MKARRTFRSRPMPRWPSGGNWPSRCRVFRPAGPRQRKGILFPGEPRKGTPGSPFLTPGYPHWQGRETFGGPRRERLLTVKPPAATCSDRCELRWQSIRQHSKCITASSAAAKAPLAPTNRARCFQGPTKLVPRYDRRQRLRCRSCRRVGLPRHQAQQGSALYQVGK